MTARFQWPRALVDAVVHEIGAIERDADRVAILPVRVRLLCECAQLAGFGSAWTSTRGPDDMFPFRDLPQTTDEVSCMACIAEGAPR